MCVCVCVCVWVGGWVGDCVCVLKRPESTYNRQQKLEKGTKIIIYILIFNVSIGNFSFCFNSFPVIIKVYPYFKIHRIH